MERRSGLWLRGLLAVVFVTLLAAAGTFYFEPLAVNDARIRFNLYRQHVASEYVEVDGYRLHYFEAMPSDGSVGKPLVLVHGLGARGEDWSGMIPALAAHGFHVYAPDLLGYGRSPKPDVDYSISLEEKTVADFMQAKGIGKADVAGWSMGGWITLKLAADHPERLDRVVLYDAAGVYFPPTFDASLFTPTDAAGLARLQRMLSPGEPKPLPKYVVRAVVERLQASAWVIARSVHGMEGGKDLMDFRLNEIKAPTLVVWGGVDQLIPLQVGETIHRGIAGSSLLVVDGCGHLAPAECLQPVLKGTIAFLSAEPAVRGGGSGVPRESR